MNEFTYKLTSFCIFAMIVLGIIGMATVGFTHTIDDITNYATTSLETKAQVDIARLDAQARITVGCEENSWFTSMISCMREGGVNGQPGLNWWFWGPIAILAAWFMRNPITEAISMIVEWLSEEE